MPFLTHDMTLENYRRFVQRVAASELAWVIRVASGFAFAESHDGTDDTPATPVLLFWSDRAYAVRHAKEDWSAYAPKSIPLAEFLARWLPGMDKDRALVGPNWDAHLCGLEVEPLEVAANLGET